MLKKYFPASARATELVGLVISIIIYLVAPSLFGLVVKIFSGVPLIGWLFGVVAGLLGLYCFIGIIVSLVIYFKNVK